MGLSHLGITKQKNGRSKEKSLLLPCFLSLCRKSGLKTCGFLHFIEFFVLSPFPRSSYLYTILAPQPAISALNPFAPGVFSLKIRFSSDYNRFLGVKPLI
jgi:hypothetical protein